MNRSSRKAIVAAGYVLLMVAISYGQTSANVGDRIVCTQVQPISWRMILPETRDIAGEVSTAVNVIACRGEFESASFVFTALDDVTLVNLRPGKLTYGKNVIPASCVDIRWVKCWYQCESAWVGINVGKRQPVLVPELLLKDDDLIRVDAASRKNYIRLSYPEERKYVCISDPTVVKREKRLSVDEFPVADSPVLKPVDIKKRLNKQVWVTVRVPSSAASGVYSGWIDVFMNGKVVGKLSVKVKVLPFELAPPNKEFSLYYHGQLVEGKGTIGTNFKSEAQLRAELRNMRDHGVTNPMFRMPLEKDRHLLEKYLQIRRELGMTGAALYYMDGGTFYWDFKKSNVANLERKTREVVKLAKTYGFTDAYIYGVDEARPEFLAGQHNAFKAVHKAGGKVFQAGYWGTVDHIGGLMDLQVYAGTMSRDQARKWHAKGSKVYNYGNPQVGVENPWIYRRNYGLLLYHYEYDGVMDYAYQHGFGHIWNDFDGTVWRDHVFAYPTKNGVIDTIAWEGFREAVDDVRYLSTLDNHISQLPQQQAKAAKEQRNRMLMHIAGEEDFDRFRQKIIQSILPIHHQKGARYIFPKKWKFHKDPENKGRELGWQKPEYDDSKWMSIEVPKAWEKTQAGDYDGYAWYRTEFSVPDDLRDKELILYFNAVDEQAWVYINGQLVGEHTVASTGKPPKYIWNASFAIHLKGVNKTGPNRISIRVHDSGAQGGIFKPVYLKAR